MLNFQDDSFIDSFEKEYYHPGKFMIIKKQIDLAQFLEHFLVIIKRTHRFGQYALIKLDNPFLPFLSVQENLMIEVPEKKKELHSLTHWLETFQLSEQVLEKKPNELSAIECLKLQLIHEILLGKKIILLPDISAICSTHELQDLLRILKIAANQSTAAILLTTNDEKILSSSYHST